MRPESQFELAKKVRSKEGAALGEIFSFVSGLYFRGKLAYANKFASAPLGLVGCFAITSNRGLVDLNTTFNMAGFASFSQTEIDGHDPEYRLPLKQSALELKDRLGKSEYRVVLLGSIATGKYVDLLGEVFGHRLHFPLDFVGRGDMSRGGLMLRCVTSGEELSYAPVADAIRHGTRPPKLTPVIVSRREKNNGK
ncbi:MAG: hypothetical protein JWM04_572 [Verrucomicrobiales bacterium]|nr:hypothetical protein [Verrucomicrobiales bacterium]